MTQKDSETDLDQYEAKFPIFWPISFYVASAGVQLGDDLSLPVIRSGPMVLPESSGAFPESAAEAAFPKDGRFHA